MKNNDSTEIKYILSFKLKSQIINMLKFGFNFLTFIFVFVERKLIIKEENNYPLLSIDDNMNEELYKNIIKQSQFPDDENLIIEYLNIRKSVRNSSSLNLINENNEIDKTTGNINSRSIGVNSEIDKNLH